MDRRCIIWRFGELFFIVIGIYAVCSTLLLQTYLDPFLRFWSASSQIKSRELLENVCEPGFTLEKHKNELHHGDVCRATDRSLKFLCPTGCFNPGKDDGPFCESLDSSLPCRVPTALRGPAKIIDASIAQLPKKNGFDFGPAKIIDASIAQLAKKMVLIFTLFPQRATPRSQIWTCCFLCITKMLHLQPHCSKA